MYCITKDRGPRQMLVSTSLSGVENSKQVNSSSQEGQIERAPPGRYVIAFPSSPTYPVPKGPSSRIAGKRI
jgi:hypothetical protein